MDERANLASVLRCTKAMALFVADVRDIVILLVSVQRAAVHPQGLRVATRPAPPPKQA